MKKNVQLSHSLLLAGASLIWGFAFVAQTEGGDAVGAFSFNSIRFIIGSIVLWPVIALLDRLKLSVRRPETGADRAKLIKGGVLSGVALCLASGAQQLAITLGSSTGKAGFITAVYILLVPIIGLLFKKKCGWNIWLGVAIALAGLYFLCINGSFSVSLVDGLLLACAFLFSIQILLVGNFSEITDPVRLSSVEFMTCGLLSAIPAYFFEVRTAESVGAWLSGFASQGAVLSILYAGVLSSGVAYTLQAVGEVGLNPALASLIMSFESVFAALSGWLLLGQKLSVREFIGCALMFAAIIIAQMPSDRGKSCST